MSDFRAAVLGSPIEHSVSPQIHQFFAKQFAYQLDYTRLQVDTPELPEVLSTLASLGYHYVNLTSPLKQVALPLCKGLTARAIEAQAVNTVLFKGKDYYGDFTDGIGLVNALESTAPLLGKRILILGAGGVVTGLLASLTKQGATEIVVTNRSYEKAHNLIKRYDSVQAQRWGNVSGQQFDWVINTVSASVWPIERALSGLDLSNTDVMDIKYGEAAAPFLGFAQKAGAKRLEAGLSMLWYQAIESFNYVFAKRPNLPMHNEFKAIIDVE